MKNILLMFWLLFSIQVLASLEGTWQSDYVDHCLADTVDQGTYNWRFENQTLEVYCQFRDEDGNLKKVTISRANITTTEHSRDHMKEIYEISATYKFYGTFLTDQAHIVITNNAMWIRGADGKEIGPLHQVDPIK